MKKILWAGDAPGGNYTDKVAAFVAQLQANGNGHLVAHIQVSHDDWCAIFRQNPCNCDPDIEVRRG